jgi:hypothetical protein
MESGTAENPYQFPLRFTCMVAYGVFKFAAKGRQSNQSCATIGGIGTKPYITLTFKVSEKFINGLLCDLHLLGDLCRPQSVQPFVPEHCEMCAVEVLVPFIPHPFINALANLLPCQPKQRTDPGRPLFCRIS